MEIKNIIGETTEYDKKLKLEVKKPKSWCKSISAFANTSSGFLRNMPRILPYLYGR